MASDSVAATPEIPAATSSPVKNETLETLRNSVVCVLIKSREGHELVDACSGFVIWSSKSGNCLIMTCRHVLGKYDQSMHVICVRFSEPRVELFAETGPCSVEADLALLKIKGLKSECKALEFGNSSDVPLNDPVHLLGYLIPPMKENEPCAIPRYAGVDPGRNW